MVKKNTCRKKKLSINGLLLALPLWINKYFSIKVDVTFGCSGCLELKFILGDASFQ